MTTIGEIYDALGEAIRKHGRDVVFIMEDGFGNEITDIEFGVDIPVPKLRIFVAQEDVTTLQVGE